MAHPKHEQVRQRYGLHCGYCGVAEEDVGGELTVDHYVPVSAGGDETDGNLVYACHRCNLYKGDFRSNEEDIRFGRLVYIHCGTTRNRTFDSIRAAASLKL